MRRRICWFERLEEGIKREVQVSFKGKKQIIWKIVRSDLLKDEQVSTPSQEDWENLQTRAENWYRRRALPFEMLELIRNERAKSGIGTGCTFRQDESRLRRGVTDGHA